MSGYANAPGLESGTGPRRKRIVVSRLRVTVGQSARMSPLVRRVIAENPSAFTFHGTGTYIVGHGEVAVIDPGPLLDAHLDALLRALEGETVTHILITHTHSDHSPAAAPLAMRIDSSLYRLLRKQCNIPSFF